MIKLRSVFRGLRQWISKLEIKKGKEEENKAEEKLKSKEEQVN